jgi:hypothetical protein
MGRQAPHAPSAVLARPTALQTAITAARTAIPRHAIRSDPTEGLYEPSLSHDRRPEIKRAPQPVRSNLPPYPARSIAAGYKPPVTVPSRPTGQSRLTVHSDAGTGTAESRRQALGCK